MNIKLIVVLVVLALLWWLYEFCGGDLTCPNLDHAIRSSFRWLNP
jgi:hypothetical protein